MGESIDIDEPVLTENAERVLMARSNAVAKRHCGGSRARRSRSF
jgi:hypothetical protein